MYNTSCVVRERYFMSPQESGDSDPNMNEALKRVQALQAVAAPPKAAPKVVARKQFSLDQAIEAGNNHAASAPFGTAMRHLARRVEISR